MKQILCLLFLLCSAAFAETPSAARQIQSEITQIAKKAIPAVVSIQVEAQPSRYGSGGQFGFEDPFDMFGDDFFNRFFGMPRGGGRETQPNRPVIGQGSGFLVSPDGLILTNNHVVADAQKISVLLEDGRKFDAKLIGADAGTDLAVIKVEAKELPYLELGRSKELEVGAWVIAIGNPLGLQASLTVGVVSAKGRHLSKELADFSDFIQTDAAINRGNSGGPLLDLDGKVIGINAAIASHTGGYMGIGFAIPSDMAEPIMEQLISKGSVTRGYLGVMLQSVDSELAQAFNLEHVQGALVTEVLKDSPAAKAGLTQGDIILEFNGQTVDSTHTLRNAVALMTPGTELELKILRSGKPTSVRVSIGANPGEALADSSSTPGKIGIEVEDLNDTVAEQLGIFNETGVIVSQVKPNSPAADVGLRRGTLIMAVNHKKIASIIDFYNALDEAAKSTKRALLLIKQGQSVRYVTIKFE